MKDGDYVTFLQWALPRLNMRWPGFRSVRGQVCKRIDRRMRELGCPEIAAYRHYLQAHPEEWVVLDGLCRITISRFHRDRGVFARLFQEMLPGRAAVARARGAHALRIWSAGCASGEEPYTLSIGWQLMLAYQFPHLELDILATDIDSTLLRRAAEAVYPASALRDLPAGWRERAFDVADGAYRLRPEFRERVRLRHHDLRTPPQESDFDLILCRNLAFTYFDPALQRRVAATLHDHLLPGGFLVLGTHESLPGGAPFEPVAGCRLIYRRSDPRPDFNR